jgi:hypothetical protein
MWRFSGFRDEYNLGDFPLCGVIAKKQNGVKELGELLDAKGGVVL